MDIKVKLYNLCLEFVSNKLQTVNLTINEIQESLLSETKSSAGDKHETGRAMLQLEREKAGQQLAEIEKTKQILSKINPETTSKNIGLGSVIFTTQSNYFISISAGELKVENDTFYAISASTPIGKLLMGKTVENEVVFNERRFTITKIY